MKYRILKGGHPVMERGRVVTPEQGAIVEFSDPGIGLTFVKNGWACVHQEAQEEQSLSPEEEGVAAVTADQTPIVVATDEELSWADVPGISEGSLELLQKALPAEHPLKVSRASILKALDGSEARARYVYKALDEFRSDAGEDAADDSGAEDEDSVGEEG